MEYAGGCRATLEHALAHTSGPTAKGNRLNMFFKLPIIVLTLLGMSTAGTVSAHATIVFGTIRVEPNPPQVAQPLELQLELIDPSSVAVEDAFVLAEVVREGEVIQSVQFMETDTAGIYQAGLQVDQPGDYGVTLRDQTFRQEEAVADVQLAVGGDSPLEPVEFVLPPAAVGGSLTTWLIWLIVVPVVAGLVVTLLVLRSGPDNSKGQKEKQ